MDDVSQTNGHLKHVQVLEADPDSHDTYDHAPVISVFKIAMGRRVIATTPVSPGI